jgi:hypothetical protein
MGSCIDCYGVGWKESHPICSTCITLNWEFKNYHPGGDYQRVVYERRNYAQSLNETKKNVKGENENMSLQANQVVTGVVRLDFVNLFTAKPGKDGGKPKFGATVYLPKGDTVTFQKMQAAIAAAYEEAVNKVWKGLRPPTPQVPIHNGDGPMPKSGLPYPDECKGNWVFTATNQRQPVIKDQNGNEVLNQSDIYSGIYAQIMITFSGYFNAGSYGIGCYLDVVKKTGDGEPLGKGRVNFDEVSGLFNAPTMPNVQPNFPSQAFPGAPMPGQPAQGYAQGGYVSPAPIPGQPYTAGQPVYGQPQYGQPAYNQPAGQPGPVQYDPITGRPINQ